MSHRPLVNFAAREELDAMSRMDKSGYGNTTTGYSSKKSARPKAKRGSTGGRQSGVLQVDYKDGRTPQATFTAARQADKQSKIDFSFGDTLNSYDRKVDLILIFPIYYEAREHQQQIENPDFDRDESRKSRATRVDILKRLHAVGLDITQATNTDKTAWIVRLSAQRNLMMKGAEEMKMQARLKRTEFEIEQGTFAGFAPFSRKLLEHFEIGFTMQFGSTERQRIVLNIIKTALGNPQDQYYDQVIQRHVRDGHFQIVPLHDPHDRSDLLRLWVNGGGGFWWWCSPQPLTKIRDYFGEEIALYFGFLEHFTDSLQIPAFLGFITFCVCKATDDPLHPIVLFYTFFMNLWCIIFLEFWKRKQANYQVEWNCRDFMATAEDRLDFQGEIRRSKIKPMKWDANLGKDVENMIPQFYFKERAKRYIVTFPLLMLCILLVLGCAMMVILLNFWIVNSGALGVVGGAVGGVINSTVILILGAMYESIAIKLNDFENHQTDADYVDALTNKKFGFQFVNSYTALIVTAFLLNHVTLFSVHPVCEKAPDEKQDCTTQVSALILSTMLSNTIVGNIIETLVPYLTQRSAERKMERICEESLLPVDDFNEAAVKLYPSEHERESMMPVYEGTFNDYLEIAVQFGFTALFAAVFPLGPFLAYVNACIEIRSDAFKLVKVNQRPLYRGAADIGTWFSIFSLLAVFSTIVNVLILASTKMYHSVGFCGPTTEEKLLCAVVIEHVLVTLKFVAQDLIEDEPSDLQDNVLRIERKIEKLAYDPKEAQKRAQCKRRTMNVFESVTESTIAALEDVDVKKWRLLKMIEKEQQVVDDNSAFPTEETGFGPRDAVQTASYGERDKAGRLTESAKQKANKKAKGLKKDQVDEEMGLTQYTSVIKDSSIEIFRRTRVCNERDMLDVQLPKNNSDEEAEEEDDSHSGSSSE